MIFGKENRQLLIGSDTVPEKYGTGWYAMVEPKPSDRTQVYEAQSDGTWLNVTPAETVVDNTDRATSLERYNTLMSILEDLPVPQSVVFMIMYHELREYQQHGTIGILLFNVVQKSGLTGTQVVNYLTPLMDDLSVAMGSMIGRRL